MLGMAIGTASVVCVVSIGLLGREYVISLIEGVGSNLVFAYGIGGGVNPEELTFEDVDAFRAAGAERRGDGAGAERQRAAVDPRPAAVDHACSASRRRTRRCATW